MRGNMEQILQGATIDRTEWLEHQYEHGTGKEMCEAEQEAYKRLSELFNRLSEDERTSFSEYCDARTNNESDKIFYIYQNGFMDGVRAMRAMMKW